MTKIQKQLSGIVEAYYTELMDTDISAVEDYIFSEKHVSRMQEAYDLFERPQAAKTHSIRRRVIIALIVAALIGTITAAAYESVRRFFTNKFSDHTEVRSAAGSMLNDKHKETFERKYTVTVPDGYTLDEEGSTETDEYIDYVYYDSDRSNYIRFSQTVRSSYKSYVDNNTELETKLDKHGQEIIVHNYENTDVIIIWDNGEYVFVLDANMSEAELMDIYYTVK